MTFGKQIQRARKILLMSQGELAAKAGVSSSLLHKIEKDRPGPSVKAKATVAKLLGVPFDVAAELDVQNVVPSSKINIPPFPIYDSNVAAGGWVDGCLGGAFDPDNHEHQAILRFGRFAIRIVGDSMEKVWPNGSHVLFRVLRDESPVVGKCYYVCRSDNLATFKKLESADEDQLVFRAVNKRRYPQPMPVAVQEVVRMAEAEFIFVRPKE